MALIHDGYGFEGARHGIVRFGPLETPLHIGRFNGVNGVSVIADEPKDQVIFCDEVWLRDYETQQGIKDAIDAIQLQQGKLTGTLFVTGPAELEVPKCTFASFECELEFFDGTGQHGWVCRGRLTWLRRG